MFWLTGRNEKPNNGIGNLPDEWKWEVCLCACSCTEIHWNKEGIGQKIWYAVPTENVSYLILAAREFLQPNRNCNKEKFDDIFELIISQKFSKTFMSFARILIVVVKCFMKEFIHFLCCFPLFCASAHYMVKECSQSCFGLERGAIDIWIKMLQRWRTG